MHRKRRRNKMQFRVQVSVPSTVVVYLQKLLDAGMLSVDSNTGKAAANKQVKSKLQELHKDVAAGDAAIVDDLNKALDLALGGGVIAMSI